MEPGNDIAMNTGAKMIHTLYATGSVKTQHYVANLNLQYIYYYGSRISSVNFKNGCSLVKKESNIKNLDITLFTSRKVCFMPASKMVHELRIAICLRHIKTIVHN